MICSPELDGRETPFIALLGVVQAGILVPFRWNSVHRSDRGGLPENELDAEAKMPIAALTLPFSRVTGIFGCDVISRTYEPIKHVPLPTAK
jgi:hypothetical protein